MKIISAGEEWLDFLKFDIEQKYNITNPIFIYNFKTFLSESKITKWIDEVVRKHRSVKYKHLSKNIFELKDFHPNPSFELCRKKTFSFIEKIKEKALLISNKRSPFFIYHGMGFAIYNEKEIIKILIYYLQNQGKSVVYEEHKTILDPNSKKNRLIFDIHFDNQELGKELKEGFIKLENKY